MTRALLTLGIAIALMSGCEGTTRAGTEYEQGMTGELELVVVDGLQDVHETALNVLEEELRYQIVSQRRDALEGVIEAETAVGDDVRVRSTYIGDDRTRIGVKYGTFGNEREAREVLSRIEAALE